MSGDFSFVDDVLDGAFSWHAAFLPVSTSAFSQLHVGFFVDDFVIVG